LVRDLTTAGRRRNKLLALALGAMPLCLCSTAWADRYWIDSVTAGSWSNGANWNSTSATGSGGAGAPGSSDNVYLQNTTSSAYTVALDESDTISTLQIGDAGGGTDTLSQTGTFNFSMATEQVAAASNSVGVHTQSAGTNTYSGVLYVGYGLKSVGTYNLSGTGAIGLSGGASTIDVGHDANFYDILRRGPFSRSEDRFERLIFSEWYGDHQRCEFREGRGHGHRNL
jgi:hypothetical protein